MRAASTACTVAGTWMRRQGLRQAIGARLADQHPGLHQRAHALLQEEGIALGARDQEPLERCQAGVVPQQGLEELVGARRRQRIEPQLRVVGLAAPAVLVLRAVVDQQQEAGRGQALDEAVEQRLGLGIDPVQVFEDQQQRLHLAFAQQHALERVERALAALRRIELRKGLSSGRASSSASSAGMVSWSVSSSVRTCPVTLARMVRGVVALLHMDIALEQVDNREVGRGLAVGHRGTLQHPPALRVVGVDKLIDQAGLPHPGLPDEGHDLAVAGSARSSAWRRAASSVLPPDKARQPPRRRGLQAPPERTRPRPAQRPPPAPAAPSPGTGPSGVTCTNPSTSRRVGGREQDAARGGELFHARRQVRGLADRRVVHVQVIANGAHHHLAGVEPDADLHGDAMGAAHLVGIVSHRRLHGQGRVAGPHGMVFMGQRGPKQRHDAVAHDLVHRALVAVHGGHHALQHRVEELAGLFGIAVGQQLHRAFEVGKQHRDLLALAFQGTAVR